MTDFSPGARRRAATPVSPPPSQPASPQPEPVAVAHGGFGKFYRVDLAGNKLGEPMTKAEAEASGLPKLGQKAAPQKSDAVAPAQPEAADKLAPRRRRAKVGGFSMKLTAPARPGYTRRWFNDSGNRLAEAEELGYEHVTETGLKTSSPGSRVSRLVGTQANGEPLHAFLMETPDELYAEGAAEKEAVARQVDEAITRGKATSDGQMSQIPESETYGHGEIRSDR